MTELMLHFDPVPGADATALARQLTQRCEQLAEVEAAQVPATGGNRIAGVDDVLLVLTVSAQLLGAGALTLEALKRLIVAVKGVAEELGYKNLMVQADGGNIPPEELTEADAHYIAKPAHPTS